MHMVLGRGTKLMVTAFAALFLAQCSKSDLASPTSPGAVAPTSASTAAVGDITNSTPEFGKIKVCKSGNQGTFQVNVKSTNNGNPSPNPSGSSVVAIDTCEVVAEDNTNTSPFGTIFTINESSAGCLSATRNDLGTGITPITCGPTDYFLNAFHGITITVTNTPPPPPAQLAVVKTPDGGTFNQGAQVSYTIVVSNPAAAGSSSATNVTLADALPGNGGLVWQTATTSQGTCVSPIVGNNLSCSLGTIAPGGSVTVTVTSTATTPDAACQSQPNAAAIATSGSLTAQDSGSLSCTPPPPPGLEGCTPGYWKQDQHFDSWPAPYLPSSDFDATFGVNFFNPNITLLEAAGLGGGGVNALARHAVAALLNSASAGVDYPYTTAQVLAIVQGTGAFAGQSVEARKNLLEAANQLGCPLS
jgi:uncharacterized repeat protein (TIGR01451 family)